MTKRGRAPVPRAAPTTALRLVVVEGPDRGASAALQPDREVVAGSGRGVDLRLTDATATTRVASFEATAEGVRVRDLGGGGVRLGAVRIFDALLPPGARVGLASTVVRVELVRDVDNAAERLQQEGFVHASDASREVAERVGELAPYAMNLLIHGETGTGKEVVARAIHRMSMRANAHFEVVDCGALPANLIESELFGHERGAFTGAERERRGAFERAHGGTLLLDEIGELPLSLQPVLLGVLQRGELRRVGGVDLLAIDVRVLAATNRDLKQEVEQGHFRSDLYYRLATSQIHLPPLRDRLDDLLPIAQAVVTELCGDAEHTPIEPILDVLKKHAWPGNVRELRAVMQHFVATGRLELNAVGHAAAKTRPPSNGPIIGYRDARAAAINEFEHQFLSNLIERCDGNASEAARLAGMDRPYLLKLLRRHGLR